jgi:hypothetical protein
VLAQSFAIVIHIAGTICEESGAKFRGGTRHGIGCVGYCYLSKKFCREFSFHFPAAVRNDSQLGGNTRQVSIEIRAVPGCNQAVSGGKFAFEFGAQPGRFY